jgi:hypothetical protein
MTRNNTSRNGNPCIAVRCPNKEHETRINSIHDRPAQAIIDRFLFVWLRAAAHADVRIVCLALGLFTVQSNCWTLSPDKVPSSLVFSYSGSLATERSRLMLRLFNDARIVLVWH